MPLLGGEELGLAFTPEEHDLIIGPHDHGELPDLQPRARPWQHSPGLRFPEGLLDNGVASLQTEEVAAIGHRESLGINPVGPGTGTAPPVVQALKQDGCTPDRQNSVP